VARVGRLAGAILAETAGAYYLVGHPKVPCDWRASGFDPPREPPGAIDAKVSPVVRLALAAAAPPALGSPVLVVEIEGEALPGLLADAFVIPRTGSVSERLWRLAIGQSDDSDDGPPDVIPARWLGELPPAIWQIVRDTVLRCT
jgi:hypothetical protein